MVQQIWPFLTSATCLGPTGKAVVLLKSSSGHFFTLSNISRWPFSKAEMTSEKFAGVGLDPTLKSIWPLMHPSSTCSWFTNIQIGPEQLERGQVLVVPGL